jgi:hypothetical protein
MAGVSVARCLAALAVIWVMCSIVPAQAQGEDDLARLHAELHRLHRQRQCTEPVPIAQRYVELVSETGACSGGG